MVPSPFASQLIGRSAGRARPTLATLESSQDLRKAAQFEEDQKRYSIDAIKAKQESQIKRAPVEHAESDDESDGEPKAASLSSLYGRR